MIDYEPMTMRQFRELVKTLTPDSVIMEIFPRIEYTPGRVILSASRRGVGIYADDFLRRLDEAISGKQEQIDDHPIYLYNRLSSDSPRGIAGLYWDGPGVYRVITSRG